MIPCRTHRHECTNNSVSRLVVRHYLLHAVAGLRILLLQAHQQPVNGTVDVVPADDGLLLARCKDCSLQFEVAAGQLVRT